MTLALSFVAVVLLGYLERRFERAHARPIDIAEAWQHRKLVENNVTAIRANHRRIV